MKKSERNEKGEGGGGGEGYSSDSFLLFDLQINTTVKVPYFETSNSEFSLYFKIRCSLIGDLLFISAFLL